MAITFSATKPGRATGTINIADSISGATLTQTVSLVGTGVAPAARTLATAAYPAQAVGTTSASKTFTLTNKQTVTVTGIAISTTTCSTTLAPGGSCAIGVTFTPTATGTRTGTLSLTDSGRNSPQTANLTGTGSLRATLSPASVTYPAQTAGTASPAKMLVLTNLDKFVALANIVISTTGDFQVSASTCGTTLAPGANCRISLTFTPMAAGTRTGTVSVTDSATNSPQTANLTGTGQ